MALLPEHFVDVLVIYKDEEVEGNWIAHSLNTDHVAVGNCALNAYVALEEVLDKLLHEVSRNKKIKWLRSAPMEIQEKLKTARPFPKELLEIAEIRRSGRRKKAPKELPWGGRAKTLKAEFAMAV